MAGIPLLSCLVPVITWVHGLRKRFSLFCLSEQALTAGESGGRSSWEETELTIVVCQRSDSTELGHTAILSVILNSLCGPLDTKATEIRPGFKLLSRSINLGNRHWICRPVSPSVFSWSEYFPAFFGSNLETVDNGLDDAADAQSVTTPLRKSGQARSLVRQRWAGRHRICDHSPCAFLSRLATESEVR